MLETVFEVAGAASIVLVLFGIPAIVVLCAGLQYPTLLAGEDLGPDVGDAPLGTYQITAETVGGGEDERTQEGESAPPSKGEDQLAEANPDAKAGGAPGGPPPMRSAQRSPNAPAQEGSGGTGATGDTMGSTGRRPGSTPGASGRRDQQATQQKGSQCKRDEGVTKIAPTTWTLSQDFVERSSDVRRMQARLDWHETRGKRDGFVISRIGCGPLRQMGLANGDVVHAINGKRVRTLTKAFFVWQNVKKQSAVRIELTRRGTRRTHTYLVK